MSAVAGRATPMSIGLLAAIGGAAFFSTKSIFIKLAYLEGASADAFLFWRMTISLPIYLTLGALALSRRPATAPRLPAGLIAAAAGNGLLAYCIASWLDFHGLSYIPAQLARLILFTYPFFVVVFGALFFGQALRKGVWRALGIAYAGLTISLARSVQTSDAHAVAMGAALVLGAAVAFALSQLFGRRIIGRMGPALYTPLAMIAACIGMIAYALSAHGFAELAITNTAMFYAFGVAIVATVIPSYLISIALGRIDADSVAMTGNFGPFFTIGLAALLLNEPLGLWEIAGAALVMIGVMQFSRSK